MKTCEFCEKEMHSSNYKRHLSKCIYKNEIKMAKSIVLGLVANHEGQDVEAAEEVPMEMKIFITELFNKVKFFYKKLNNESLSPEEKIRQLHISDSTKEGYLTELSLYQKWLKKNKKNVDIDTANTYLNSLKCKPSTLRKKQMILQTILRVVYDPNIHLNPVKLRISYMPKYSLSDQEIEKYLEEQMVDYEYYFIQRLMIIYGLRINSPAALKVKHFLFLFEEHSNQILLPDIKINNERREPIDEEFAIALNEYIESIGLSVEDPEEYVFLRAYSDNSIRVRTSKMGLEVNRKIKKSAVLRKNPNFKYTSHMFRKTKANNLFQQGLEELRERSRHGIGQKSKSSSIKHYLD
jgi:integrase